MTEYWATDRSESLHTAYTQPAGVFGNFFQACCSCGWKGDRMWVDVQKAWEHCGFHQQYHENFWMEDVDDQ